MDKETKTIQAFKRYLVRAKLLGQYSGTIIVNGNKGEDIILRQWHAMARKFIHKGQRVRVALRAERMCFNESRCWPEVTIKDY